MDSSLPLSLKAVSLTHVRYERGDYFGHFLAWVSLIPVFISLGGFVTHFLFRREIQGICFALGLLFSQFFNELIKSSVQQSRPATCAILEMCDSHGWPSSHSQYMFFFATYLSLLCLTGTGGTASSWRWRFLHALFPWPTAILTLYSRVYLGYHTVAQVHSFSTLLLLHAYYFYFLAYLFGGTAQVFAGGILGIFLGVVWFWIVNNLFVDYFPWIEESAVGRFLYIKDTSHIPNVLKFEYDNARVARQKTATD